MTVFLEELGLSHLPGPINLKKVVYHDACHLSHAQGVRAAPRRLMEQVPDVEVVNLSDGETCCGSAGIYNIEQPEIAEALLKIQEKNRKAHRHPISKIHIKSTKIVIKANLSV